LNCPEKGSVNWESGEKWGKSRFLIPAELQNICLLIDFNQILYQGSSFDVPHSDSQISQNGVRQPKNLEKNTLFITPTSENLVYQPISTKFFITVALGTSHTTIVKPSRKGVSQPRKLGKLRKIWFSDTPTALKVLFTNRLRPNFVQQ
jgi:hypothetical protein